MKYLQLRNRPDPGSFRTRFARMRRRLQARFPLLLQFLLILGLLLPASSLAYRLGRPPKFSVRADAPAQRSSAPATPPAGGGPALRVPAGEPSPEPDPMLAPGALTLDVSTILVRAGEPFTVTVQVHDDPGPSAAGSALTLDLDPALQLLSGEREWTLPALTDAPFSRQVALTAPAAQAGQVFKLTASIAQEGYAAQTRSILLGVETEQQLSVLLDPSTARGGARAAVRELDLVVAAAGPQMARAWAVEVATARGRRAAPLAAPATLVFDARPLIAEGIDPARLGLFTRGDNDDAWRPARSSYRAHEQRIVARVSHFSQWGLGERLTSGSDLLPSSAVFSSEEFTGYAQVSIPLAAPAGLGGLSPGLSLNYSSGVADDVESIHGYEEHKTQANWVGYGWSLGGFSHVSHAPGSDYYTLVLNGVAVRIYKRLNRWVTEPERFLKIEHEVEYSGYNVPNAGNTRYDLDEWVVTTTDGAVYHFGAHEFASSADARLTHEGEPLGNWTEVLFHRQTNRHHMRVGSRWLLRKVEDPNGNRIEYEYDAELGEFTCRNDHSGRVTFYGDDLRYDRISYPSQIRWSANAGAAIEAKLRLSFVREPRPDDTIEVDDNCEQARFGSERLKTVKVEAWDNPNGWHSLAEYEFGYVQGRRHSLLSSLTRKGKQGEQTLRTWRFGYEGDANSVRLTEADNGLGGSVSFRYGMEEISDCYACSDISEHPMRRPLTEAVWRDGAGGEARSVYAYSGIKGHVENGMFEYLGHAWSQRWIYTRNSELNIPNHRLEQVVATWYHQRDEEDERKIDSRRGRVKQREVYAPDDGLMQRVKTDWVIYELRDGSPWVRKEWEEVYTFDGDGDDNARMHKSRYIYDIHSLYGHLRRIEELDVDSRTVLRATDFRYDHSRTLIDKYIVSRLREERVGDGDGCIGVVRHDYDANGNLTKSARPTTDCGERDAANLIVSRIEYDAVGNVTRSWTEGATSHDVRTEYDAVFKLFPVRRYNANDNTLDETGKFYGINGDDSRGEGGFWGAKQEFCGADGVCTQQAYDEFGRASHLWAKGVGYPDRDKAQTQWRYHTWGSMGQNANVAVTQNLPLCEGNFARTLYDGFGRLIQQQSPRQGWETAQHGCSAVDNQLETVVDYGYDGLGRLLRTSVPRAVVFNWAQAADWGAGFSATEYDALGRPRVTRAPNGSETSYHYEGYVTAAIASSADEAERRMLSWQQQDQLGRTTLLRSYTPGGDDWTLESEIRRAYDGADRLTQVFRRDGGARRWQQTSSIGYDFLGRKTSMSDADLGNWSYDYNTLGQLTRQTDARDRTSCLYYDSLGRMRGRVQRTDGSCAATVADVDLESSYAYDAQGRVQSVANDNVSRSFSYDSYSRVNGVTVAIDSLTRSSSFSFDDHHRPVAVTYHGGEVVTTSYGSPGAAVGLRSSIHGDLVDNVKYDEAGRMTAMRFPAGGNLWRTQSYYPWTARRNGGMLASLKVGFDEGGGERLSRSYAYNSFGDLSALTEGTDSYAFSYDGLGRLTSAYGRTYSYDGASRLTAFNGQAYGYGDSGPYHAVDRIAGADRFDYDANGNMVKRNKGLTDEQTLVWDAENRLSQVQDDQGNLLERYWYGVEGMRVKKTRGSTTTYTFFAHYEEEVTNGVTTVVSYYTFDGLRVAVKRGNTLYHLHGDHLGSTSLTTQGSSTTASRAYYAYGAERSATGDLRTDRTFTGQKRDATGLLYYNARYYDPSLGTFVSPDSMVPNPAQVINYNRFLYARGNPLRYTDPTGQMGYDPLGPAWVQEFKDNHGGRAPNAIDRYDRIVSLILPGPASGSRTWTEQDWIGYATSSPHGGLAARAAGSSTGPDINYHGFSNHNDELSLLKKGFNKLAALVGGDAKMHKFLGHPDFVVFWVRRPSGLLCNFLVNNPLACAVGTYIEFYDSLFEVDLNTKDYKHHVKGTAVHELAHVVHLVVCMNDKALCSEIAQVSEENRQSHYVTVYGKSNYKEYWAESVADWVYDISAANGYKINDPGRQSRSQPMSDLIKKVFGISP